ncbi:MAG: LacI family DNA-binding transcriptional regulator [Verrucomicrobia bacterium]|nr:LacI family DNA-binding transcriptional regulator [Verrucomicrobiota bacterium]
MVRLKDIAARAGVSVMTVSKVMRDAPDISAATKARIRSLAEEMGYVPDSLAQGLRTRTTKLFGLVIPTITNPVFARTARAIEELAHEHGYDVILAHTLNAPEREEACLRRLLSRRVDGLFISPVYRLAPTAPIYDEIQKNRTPTVILGQRAPFCTPFPNVAGDDLPASYAATKHLLDLGHRRIAFFAGLAAAPWSQERADGYRRALREAGLSVEDRLIFTSGASIEDGEKAALQMLQECEDVTAVQAASDLAAIGAAHVFLSQGLRIPQDISVVGFGNILVSEHFKVPLTTLRQPKFRLGVAAMESMQKLLKGERPEDKRLAAPIVIRASTGPPPVKPPQSAG